jgi:hypothetical protein
MRYRPPLGGQVGGELGALPHAIVQRHEPRVLALELPHRPREGIAQPLDHLEQRQIDVSDTRARRHARLEVAEEPRQALREEHLRATLRLVQLVFVVEAARDRMVAVVHLDHPVHDRQLLGVKLGATGFVHGREPQLGAEVVQDRGRLRDDELARLQERRRKRALRREQALHACHALRGARDVDVARAGVFEGEAHELAAPLDLGPVIQLVFHGASPEAPPLPPTPPSPPPPKPAVSPSSGMKP